MSGLQVGPGSGSGMSQCQDHSEVKDESEFNLKVPRTKTPSCRTTAPLKPFFGHTLKLTEPSAGICKAERGAVPYWCYCDRQVSGLRL